MKKLYTYIIGALLSLSVTSCNSLFDDAPMNQISENDVWTNSMLLDEYVNTWYRNMNNGFNHFIFTSSGFGSLSRYFLPWLGDQITISKKDWLNSGYSDMLKGNEKTLTDYAENLWTNDYTQIQYINAFFENSDRISDATQRERINGEAHFFRAYYYYMLWRSFGGVPLIDHTIDPLKNAERTPRASYAEMLEFIVKEADEAARILPVTQSSAETGRVTRGTALMLKAKAYLWAASEVYQDNSKAYLGFTDNQRQNMLKKAKAAYEDLFALNAYELIPIAATTQDGIKNEYRQIFLTKNSKESILEVQHSDDGDYSNKFGHRLDRYAAPPSLTGTYCAYTPTHNHVLEYGMRDGATYDANHPYDNLDYRFYANILYDGSVFKGQTLNMHTTDGVAGTDLQPYGTSTTAGSTLTGYYMGKFVDETQTIDNNDTYASKQNYIIWRLAEAKLDYAEVLFNLGYTEEARVQVNDIRQRVHMDALPTITIDQILNERRVELAFEESTYWDMFRLGTVYQKRNGSTNPLKKMTITVTKGNTKYQVSNIDRRASANYIFQLKQYYLPIPWSEVKYQQFDQNPDWNEI